ncbi:molybdenum cofactor biosynthesis protein MoaE [Arthrobacter sp. UC242_113]|uniref:molybdenum cofactor biosynthesis protein MoaE n=1 Tax=Arthrobacter sp. UC242_113 TaxID=3374550 RepID=UPI003756DCB1
MATEASFQVVTAVLSTEPISVDQAIAAVESETAGAVVSFSGVVRNHDGGKPVDRLSYSAHPTARKVLDDVVAQLVAEQAAAAGADGADGAMAPPVRIWVAHRVGPLEIGDPALVCAVAAAHRGQAFTVCSELVDRVKTQVPIWKEQFFSDGTVEWVGAGE